MPTPEPGPASDTPGEAASAARLFDAVDWRDHPLGPPGQWPAVLSVAWRLVLGSPESVYLVWGPDHFFLFNDAYAPILGPRRDRAMGARLPELWADAWPAVAPLLARAFAGEASRSVDLPIAMARHGEPEETWWTFSYSPLRDDAGVVRGVLCITNETTARVQGERQRLASEQRNRQILDSATDHAIIATDPDGRITRWNEGAARIFGWTERAMLGETAHRFFTPEDVLGGRVEAEMQGALATGRSDDERWHRRCGGERFWARGEMTVLRDAAGHAAGFVKVLRDETAQHRAAEALRRSEASLQRAQEAGRIGIFAVELDRHLVRGTDQFCRLFGMPGCDGVPAAQVEALIHPDDRLVASNAAGRAAGSLPLDVEYRVRRADTGEERWIARRAEFERDATGRAVRLIGVVQDVTERRQAMEALAQSEAKFRAFAEAVPHHVWTATPDGRIEWGNDRAFAYTGGSLPTLRPEGWAARLHPDDMARAGTAWAAALASGADYAVEFRIRRHDGVYRWHLVRAVPLRDGAGAILRWIGTNTDIEEQRAAREALAGLNVELERRVAAEVRERDRLWSTTNDLMATCGLDGYLKEINPAWHRLLGHADATLLARPFVEIIDPADHPATADVVARLARGETVTGFTDHILAADGSLRAIMWTAVPEGALFYVVGRDMTAQLEAEERLRQSHKMEAVGQLTGGIAHDFNNMLTGVIGSLDLLKRQLAAGRTDRVDRYIDAATVSAQRAAGLTQRLLAFSRRQSLDVRAVAVDRLVGGMEELLRRTLGENVALEVSVPAEGWPALTDANQLESALLNLAINARDAMPNGGRLRIEAVDVRVDAQGPAVPDDLAPGDYVLIGVSDTGTGMAPEVVAKAFDPFFTTKPIGQGTGLGLSMIYGFARQSGGQVLIDSRPGEGTAVQLYLPRHAGTVAARADAVRDFAERAVAGECVLLVEDDPEVRMLVADVLEDLGYRTVQAGDAGEALPLLDGSGRIDLLVTDVGLPGINGRRLADMARERRPGLKVLFVTGYAEGATSRAGFLGEDMDMIAKPFATDALAAKIRRMIG